MSRLLRETALVLILPLVAAGGFYRLLLRPDSLLVDPGRPIVDRAYPLASRGIGNDLTFVFLPRYSLVLDRLAAGRGIPSWDRSGFGGRPLIGNPQAGLLYPPVWAAWRSGGASALGWLTVAHLVWGGAGAYVLIRALGVSPPSAVMAAACFEVSPYLMAHTAEGHYPHVWSASWYPWAFWAFLLARRGRASGVFAMPAVLALCFLTGHAQEWYFLVLALSCWAGFDVLRFARDGEWRRAGGRVLLWGGLLGVSLAFCAAELGPQLALGRWLLARSTIPLRMMSRYYVHVLNLFQLLSPTALGRAHDYIGHDNLWETLLSVGLVPLILAAVGVARHRDRGLNRGWLALVSVCVVFACGRRLGLYTLAYRLLPGMDRFRVPARTLFLATLGTAVLVGLGLDAVKTRKVLLPEWEALRERVRKTLAVVGIVFLAALALSRTALPLDPSGPRAPASTAWDDRGWQALVLAAESGPTWVGIVGALTLLTLNRRGWLPRRHAGVGLGILAVVEVTAAAQGLVEVGPPTRFYQQADLARRLRLEGGGPTGPKRVAAVPGLLTDLDAAAVGLEKTNVNDGFQIQHAADLYERLYPFLEPRPRAPRAVGPMDDEARRFHARVARGVLDRFSVGWVVAAERWEELGLEAEQVGGRAGPAWLLRNPDALPRAYVVPGVALPGPRAMPAAVRLSQIDPRRAVLMRRDPLPPGDRQPFTPADWIGDDPDRPLIRVATQAPGLLVVGQTWMKGWSARVDGRDERVYRGNHCQQVVAIRAAGEHIIELTYTPPRFREGLAVTTGSLAAWGLAGAAFGARRLANRRRRRPNLGRWSDPSVPLAERPFGHEQEGEEEEERPVVPDLPLGLAVGLRRDPPLE